MKFILLLLSISTAATAQICMKKASYADLISRQNITWLLFAVASYFISFMMYALLMRYFQLNKISPVMAIATTCMVVLVATVVMHEPFSIRMALGIGLGIFSIVCLLW